MTGAEYRKALAKLEMTQEDASLLFRVRNSTSHRWTANKNPIPETVALLLKTMIDKHISLDDMTAIARRRM